MSLRFDGEVSGQPRSGPIRPCQAQSADPGQDFSHVAADTVAAVAADLAGRLQVGQPAQEGFDVAAAQGRRVESVIRPAVQVLRQQPQPVDLASDSGGAATAMAGQLLGRPPLCGLGQPRLGDPGERQVAAMTEDRQIPDVLGVLAARVGQFTLPTAPGQNQTVEAESLRGSATGGTMAVQTSCCGTTWSNGAQQLFTNTASGSSFTLNYYVANAGRYAITPVMTKATDYGTVTVSVDGGTALPLTFDGYNNGVITQQFDFGGSATLAAGMHSFTFTVTGANTASTGNRYNAGVDTLILQPTAR